MTLSAAYFERKLRAILGLTGSNPIPGLADVAGLLVVENDRIEWALAGGELYGAVQGGQASVAGENSYVGIANPTESGVIGVVEDVDFSMVGAAVPVTHLQMVTGTAFDTLFAGSLVANLVTIDGRIDQLGFGVGTPLKFITGSQVGIGGLAFWNSSGTVAGVIGRPPPQVVLGPRSAVVLATVGLATAISSVNWFARSRPLEGRLGIA